MILKLLFALIFTNIIGIIYDLIQGTRNITKKKFYLYSSPKILMMVFIRNIISSLKFLTLNKRLILDSLATIFFVSTIYFLINFQADNLKTKLIFLFISSFVFWSIAYAFVSITSDFFYNGNPTKFSEKELKIISGEATLIDKIILFFQNLLASLLSFNIYILAGITTTYTYFIGNWF
ncbi:hypothetical protein [Aquimarina intermedia]|uniref:Uncharacterized protein n=1 Tax=Aquimarina intermedia TaxID=350814 RepID=A0A5S5BWU0_9FLAO|nr:hypothetical protein [Aquimarina intermedia]TYP71641.1 hypothetical protein BD809_10851 [Aquimarina intermedia]